MKLLSNLIAYKTTLPDAAAMAGHLAEKPFTPVLETFVSSCGFIPFPGFDLPIKEFAGGYAFRFRLDAKAISKKGLRLEQDEQIAAKEKELERALTKEEREDIKDAVLSETVKNALPERTELTAYYHPESRFLLIPTTNKNLASMVISKLVEACGSITTTTIHVSGVKSGLTSRLNDYFIGGNERAFEGFSVGDSAVMKGERGKASFDLENLAHAREGLIEALRGGMQAERLELVHADVVSFRLTKDFHLRTIEFIDQPPSDDEPEWESVEEQWQHEAGAQVLLLVALLEALCDLFGYEEPAAHEASEGEPDSDQDSNDLLLGEARAFVVSTRRASISAVQRKLRIGYNRAARLIEALEAEGTISPIDLSGSREVLAAGGAA